LQDRHKGLSGYLIPKDIKLPKGILLMTIDDNSTDSVLVIERGNSIDTVPIKKVSYIKTKHSFGNNILIGTAIAAPTLAIISAIGNEPCDNCIFSTTDGELPLQAL
jgi:hypothetical protein